MAYKYHTQEFLERKVPFDFKGVFADKQKKAGDQLNLSFNLVEIVDFIKKQSEDFTRQDQHLMDLDAAVKKIVEQYEKVTEAPKDKDAASIQPKPNYEVGANKPLKAITTPKKVGEEPIQEPVTPVEEALEVAADVEPVSKVVPAAEKLEEAVEQVIAAKAEMTKADWSEKIQSLEDLLELDPDDAEVADKVAALKDLYELEFDESYGSASSSSEKTWEQEMAEENDKQLSAAGFDVSKLTAEQKDVILEPSNAPENYSQDGELNAKQAESAWTRNLENVGLNKEQIKRAKNMQLGTKMEHGGAVVDESNLGVDVRKVVERSETTPSKWIFTLTYADLIDGKKVWRPYPNYISEKFKTKGEAEFELEKTIQFQKDNAETRKAKLAGASEEVINKMMEESLAKKRVKYMEQGGVVESAAKAALQNLVDRDLIKDKEGDHYDEAVEALSENNEDAIYFALKNLIDNDLIFDTDADAYTEAVDAVSGAGQTFEKGGETSSLKVESRSDLEAVAKYMTKAVNKHSWDLKDLIHYFEVDNNFDYKVRSKVWADMNMYEAKKTYDNILKLLTAIVEGNGKHIEKMEHGGVVTNFAIPQMGQVEGYAKGGAVGEKFLNHVNGDLDAFTLLLLRHGFIEKKGAYGIRKFFHEKKGYASLDMKNRELEVNDDRLRFAISDLAEYLKANKFKEEVDGSLIPAKYKGWDKYFVVDLDGEVQGEYNDYLQAVVFASHYDLKIVKEAKMEDGGEVKQFARPQIGAMQTVRLVEDAPKFTKGGSIGGKPLYTKAELLKKYKGKFIDTYPHHHEYTNPDTHRYETVYEVRGVSSKIKENYQSPEEVVE